MRTPRRISRLLGAVLAALTVTACATKGTDIGRSDEPATRHTPTVERTLDTAVSEVRDRLSELSPELPWRSLSAAATSPCNTSDGPGGTWHTTDHFMATGANATAEQWPEWKRAVAEILTRHGFDAPQDLAPAGLAHMLKYTNAEGDVVTFSANPKGTGIRASSSCFIAEDKQPTTP